MEKTKTYTLFDTNFLNYTDKEGYDYYLEFCEINEIEPKGDNSSEFIEWACEEAQEGYECDRENLKYSKADKENYPFFIDGTLGLWNGQKEGHYTKIYWGISSALDAIMYGCSYDDADAQLDIEAGVIYVNGHHHDGTNCFTIHLLSKRGLDKVQRDIDNYVINDYGYELKDYCFKKIRQEDLW